MERERKEELLRVFDNLCRKYGEGKIHQGLLEDGYKIDRVYSNIPYWLLNGVFEEFEKRKVNGEIEDMVLIPAKAVREACPEMVVRDMKPYVIYVKATTN